MNGALNRFVTNQPARLFARTFIALVTCLFWVGSSGCAADSTSADESAPDRHRLDDQLRLNHVQAKGTHNSYHLKPKVALQPWDYSHAPLLEQLEKQGVRQFELDLFWNADKDDYDVLHFPQIDAETTCETLTICLEGVRRWLAKRPGALPPMLWLEPKDEDDPTKSDPAYARLEAIVKAVKWPRGIVTPDDVRGDAKDLKTAIATTGWPTLGQVRGKPMFVMLDGGSHRDAYVKPDPSLKGRLLFAEGGPDDPWGVVAKIDNPLTAKAKIQAAVKAGRLIRTRADTNSAERKSNDKTRLQAGLESGAQAISTDYPAKVEGVAYFVDIPGGSPARCNPITAPAACTTDDVEKLDPLPLDAF